MKIAIKHRTNDCKDYMGSHTTVIIENLKEFLSFHVLYAVSSLPCPVTM